MSTAKAIRFLESVAHFRPMIRIFGGEPFLHPHWPTIFSAAVARGLPITVVTNGTRLLGRAEERSRRAPSQEIRSAKTSALSPEAL